MRLARAVLGVALVGCVVCANSASAQDYGRSGRDYGGESGRDYGRGYDRDRDYGGSVSTAEFVQQAAQGGMAEVSLGILARRRASDQDVRDFADQMVQDHLQANRELDRLAARKGFSVPNRLDMQHRMTLARLRRWTGDTFDRQYMREMVRDHMRTVALFREYARDGGDPDLRAWANRTLPTLLEHRRMADETAGTVNAGYEPDRYRY